MNYEASVYYDFKALPDELKEEYDERYFYENKGVLVVTHNGKILRHECARMEPEDVHFCRDLKWVPVALREAYDAGRDDAYDEVASNSDESY